MNKYKRKKVIHGVIMNIFNKMQWLTILGCAFVMLVSSCSITQDINPYQATDINEICIIEDTAVRSGFLRAYKKALQEKGYRTKILDENSNHDDCELTTTYTGRWSWDMALYMAYAEIRVYRDGVKKGEAIYDATGGAGLPKKWIKAEEKIKELVNLLFPNKIQK